MGMMRMIGRRLLGAAEVLLALGAGAAVLFLSPPDLEVKPPSLMRAFAQAPQVTQCVTNAPGGGTVNAITVPLLPCGLATNLLLLTSPGTNTLAGVTLQMVGGAALPVKDANGNALGVGAMPPLGGTALLTSTGSQWRLLGTASSGQIQNVASIAALEALSNPVGVGIANVQGYYTPFDLGGGYFTYTASVIATDSCISFPALGGGTWVRQGLTGKIRPEMCGAKGDDPAWDDTTGWNAVAALANQTTGSLHGLLLDASEKTWYFQPTVDGSGHAVGFLASNTPGLSIGGICGGVRASNGSGGANPLVGTKIIWKPNGTLTHLTDVFRIFDSSNTAIRCITIDARLASKANQLLTVAFHLDSNNSPPMSQFQGSDLSCLSCHIGIAAGSLAPVVPVGECWENGSVGNPPMGTLTCNTQTATLNPDYFTNGTGLAIGGAFQNYLLATFGVPTPSTVINSTSQFSFQAPASILDDRVVNNACSEVGTLVTCSTITHLTGLRNFGIGATPWAIVSGVTGELGYNTTPHPVHLTITGDQSYTYTWNSGLGAGTGGQVAIYVGGIVTVNAVQQLDYATINFINFQAPYCANGASCEGGSSWYDPASECILQHSGNAWQNGYISQGFCLGFSKVIHVVQDGGSVIYEQIANGTPSLGAQGVPNTFHTLVESTAAGAITFRRLQNEDSGSFLGGFVDHSCVSTTGNALTGNSIYDVKLSVGYWANSGCSHDVFQNSWGPGNMVHTIQTGVQYSIADSTDFNAIAQSNASTVGLLSGNFWNGTIISDQNGHTTTTTTAVLPDSDAFTIPVVTTSGFGTGCCLKGQGLTYDSISGDTITMHVAPATVTPFVGTATSPGTTTMTVSGVSSGFLFQGMSITGTGVGNCPLSGLPPVVVGQLTGSTPGGTGTYTTNCALTFGSTTLTGTFALAVTRGSTLWIYDPATGEEMAALVAADSTTAAITVTHGQIDGWPTSGVLYLSAGPTAKPALVAGDASVISMGDLAIRQPGDGGMWINANAPNSFLLTVGVGNAAYPQAGNGGTSILISDTLRSKLISAPVLAVAAAGGTVQSGCSTNDRVHITMTADSTINIGPLREGVTCIVDLEIKGGNFHPTWTQTTSRYLLKGSGSAGVASLPATTSGLIFTFVFQNQDDNTTVGSFLGTSAGTLACADLTNAGPLCSLTPGVSGGVPCFTSTTTAASSVLLTNHALVLGAGAAACPTPLASLGTTTTVLHGNAAAAPTFGAVVLTTDVSGLLPVANGGTGLGSGTSGGGLCFTSASTIASSAELVQYGVVQGGGAGSCPLTSGTLSYNTASNTAAAPSRLIIDQHDTGSLPAQGTGEFSVYVGHDAQNPVDSHYSFGGMTIMENNRANGTNSAPTALPTASLAFIWRANGWDTAAYGLLCQQSIAVGLNTLSTTDHNGMIETTCAPSFGTTATRVARLSSSGLQVGVFGSIVYPEAALSLIGGGSSTPTADTVTLGSTSNTGSIVITAVSASTWPTGPFVMLLDGGTASAEYMLAYLVDTTHIFILTRGVWGTPGAAHTCPCTLTYERELSGRNQTLLPDYTLDSLGDGMYRGTLSSGADTVTSASASALAVGLTGGTNPALQVDASTASQVAGLKITGAATGGTVALAAIDSGSNTNLTINGKGTGTIGLGTSSTGTITLGASATPTTILSATITTTNLATDATHTDRTICQDTTSKALFFGSGAAGICLGTSSLRFKHDVVPLMDGISKVMALRPISYQLDRAHGGDGHSFYGFAAEDICRTLPTLCRRDKQGRPQNYDWPGVIAVLVKAVQEQQHEIDMLKRKVH